jgi:hypothetical protein
VSIEIEEKKIPVHEEVRGACELLGLDPLYVANEGKLVAIVAPECADAILAAMRRNRRGEEAAIIGTVGARPSGSGDDANRFRLEPHCRPAAGRSVAEDLLKGVWHARNGCMGIASSILEAVEKELLRYPGCRATKVGVRIGEFAGVDGGIAALLFRQPW